MYLRRGEVVRCGGIARAKSCAGRCRDDSWLRYHGRRIDIVRLASSARPGCVTAPIDLDRCGHEYSRCHSRIVAWSSDGSGVGE